MSVEEAFKKVVKELAGFCRKVGRSPEDVQMIVVSKFQPLEAILKVHKEGAVYFGENYAQELIEKAEKVQTIKWSFIGQLQSNKIRKIMTYASEIQSLASLKHAKAIAKHAEDLGLCPYPVYVEAHVDGDVNKGGLSLEEVLPFVQEIQTLFRDKIRVKGLMIVPPAKLDPVSRKKLYKELRKLADQVGEGKLSLGMSSDFQLAIECGSDVLRLGSCIMGQRKK